MAVWNIKVLKPQTYPGPPYATKDEWRQLRDDVRKIERVILKLAIMAIQHDETIYKGTIKAVSLNDIMSISK